MSDLAVYAERIKLARLLGVDTEALDYLDDHDADALQAFRESVSDALFDRYRRTFEGMAKLSMLLPLAANAKLSEKVLGPSLSARVAGELPPKRAIALAEKLPTSFLADVSIQIDPKRARAVIGGIPPARVVDVTVEMLDRGEHVAMGRFLDSLSDAALAAATDAIESDESLLRIGFFAESPEQLSKVTRMLDRERREGVIAATAENDLWPQALSLLGHLDADLRREFGEIVLAQGEQALHAAVDGIDAYDQWPLLVEILANQDAEMQRELAAFGATRPAHEHPQVMAAADAAGLRNALATYEQAFEQAGTGR